MNAHDMTLIQLGRLCEQHQISEPNERDLLELVVGLSLQNANAYREIMEITKQPKLMTCYGSIHAAAERFNTGTTKVGSATGLNLAESHFVLALAEMADFTTGLRKHLLQVVRYARQHLMPPVKVIGQLSRKLMETTTGVAPYYRYSRTDEHQWWWERQHFIDGSDTVLPVSPKHEHSHPMRRNFIADVHEYGRNTLVTCIPYANSKDEYLIDVSDDVRLLQQIQSPLPYIKEFRRLVISKVSKYGPESFVDNALNLKDLSIAEWLPIIKAKPEKHDGFLRQSKNKSRNVAIYLLANIGKISRAKFDDAMGKLHYSRNKRSEAREVYRFLKSIYPECHTDPYKQPVKTDVVGMRKGLAVQFKRMGLY